MKDIMNEQLSSQPLLLQSSVADDETAKSLSTMLKRKQLEELYPFINPTILSEIYQATGYSMEATMRTVEGCEELMAHPQTVMTSEAAYALESDLVNIAINNSLEEEEENCLISEREADERYESYTDYNQIVASIHELYYKQLECEASMQSVRGYAKGSMAAHYAQQARLYKQQISDLRRQAMLISLNNRESAASATDDSSMCCIDLHGFGVSDAVQVLSDLILLKEQEFSACGPAQKHRQFIQVITGRGMHSAGGVAKLRPAIIDFLRRNAYTFLEKIPGQLKVRLHTD